MPTHGAQQRASETPCDFTDVVSPCAAARHGTATAYQVDRCRCDTAKRAQARYRKQLRLRHHRGASPIVDATGTRHRFHALMANGWPRAELFRRLGYSDTGTWLPYVDTINARTAEAVRRLYDEIADTPGPSGWTKTWARNQGWLPPIWWDDDTIDYKVSDVIFGEFPKQPDQDTDPVVIDRYLAGDRAIKLNRTEKQEVFHALRSRGHTLTAACAQLRLSGSTGRRYEAARTAESVLDIAHTAGIDDLEETG